MNCQKPKVEIINRIYENEYPANYTDKIYKWFKFKLNKYPIEIAPLYEENPNDGTNKIYKHRSGPLYFTFIKPDDEIKQVGYCIDKDDNYHYFSSLLNTWDEVCYHKTFAVANNILDILYVGDYY
jgi:hypothetical protein